MLKTIFTLLLSLYFSFGLYSNSFVHAETSDTEVMPVYYDSTSVGTSTEDADVQSVEDARLRKRDAQLRQEQVRDTVNQRVTENRTAVCEQVVGKVQERLGSYGDSKGSHTDKYARVLSRLDEISVKLSAKGLDTTNLDLAIGTLDNLVTEYIALYESLIAGLTDVSSYDCTQAAEVYKVSLVDSREALKAVREKRVEIRTHYRDVIRVAFQDLRDQVKEQKVQEKEDSKTEDLDIESTESLETSSEGGK